MKKHIILFVLYGGLLQAQNSASFFIKRFAKTAVTEMEKYGIPASITLAQGMTESNYAQSRLSKKANNYFGIKCHGGWKGKRIYHDDDKKGECFRKYPSAWWSFRDHSKFLQSSRYQSLYKYKIKDYKSWAKGLKKAGYATNPKYASLLIDKIEKYQLWRYDNMTAATVEEMLPNALTASFGQKKETDKAIAAVQTIKQEEEPIVAHPSSKEETKALRAENLHKIYQHPTGRLPYIIAIEGDTWNAIAQTFNIKLRRLIKYNDVALDRAVTPGQYIFFKRKRSRSKEKYHITQQGDNMYLIAQKYGIQLSKLYEKNRMQIGEQPFVGQKIFLRSRKPR